MQAGRQGRGVVLGTLTALLVLLVAAPSPRASLTTLRDLGSAGAGAADVTGPLVALLGLIAWVLTAWLVLTVAVTLLGRVPGGVGRLARRVGARVAPAAVRRTVEVALGLTVTVGVIGTGSAAAADAVSPEPTGPAGLSLDWAGTTATPDLDWPATQPAAPGTEVRAAPMSADPSAAELRAQQASAPADEVVVRPGDSLWRLAEHDLQRRTGQRPTTAQTAAAWPSWWAANREAVGDDPDLIHPGTPLAAPSPDTPGQPAPEAAPDA
jgi:resuscitation-promoting factor RpfA